MQVACRLSNSGITPNTLYNAARATWRSYAYVYVAYSMPYVPVPNVTNASLIFDIADSILELFNVNFQL
jgi:hypothetical protein